MIWYICGGLVVIAGIILLGIWNWRFDNPVRFRLLRAPRPATFVLWHRQKKEVWVYTAQDDNPRREGRQRREHRGNYSKLTPPKYRRSIAGCSVGYDGTIRQLQEHFPETLINIQTAKGIKRASAL